MTTPYDFPPIRSQRPEWALGELGKDYASKLINPQKEAHKNNNNYLSVHPLGYVPVNDGDDFFVVLGAHDTVSILESSL